MLRLLSLFEHDEKNQVARDEIMRQLGRFDEAVALLKTAKSDRYNEVLAVKIERLAAAGIAELHALNSWPLWPASLDEPAQVQTVCRVL